MLRPVWYAVTYFTGGRSTISGIGNPVIWWTGIISFLFLIIQAIRKREKNVLFILVACLCLILPYIGINRGMYLYHYFPILPFIMLANVYFIRAINEKVKGNAIYYIYILLMFAFFIYFFPAVSGIPMTNKYLDSLRWLSTWQF